MKFLLSFLLLASAPLAVHSADLVHSDALDIGKPACYNMTITEFDAANTHQLPPQDYWGEWGGEVCLEKTAEGTISVEISAFWGNSLYEARVWVGTDPADMPMKDDGTPDTSLFPGVTVPADQVSPYTGGDVDGDPDTEPEGKEAVPYKTEIEYDPAACGLIIAPFLVFAAPCLPTHPDISPRGQYVGDTDWAAWGVDLDNPNEDAHYSFLSFHLNDECEQEPRLAPPPQTPAPTPTPASSSGDPHFKTWTGDKFDYHGECDLELIDNPTFHNGQGLKVHIRTTRVDYYSYIERIAVQIGDDVLEFANDVENFWINGKLVGKKQKRKETLLGGFIVRRDPKALSIRLNGGYKDRENIAKIDLHARQSGFPGVVVDGGNTQIFEGSLGLLGDWGTGMKLARDGKTELNDEDATKFALEWQVRDTTLFQEARFPQYPTQCTPPAKMMGNRLGLSNMKEQAEKACANFKGDKEDCIFDVIATRSTKAASTE